MEKITSLLKKLSDIASKDERLDGLTFQQGTNFSWDYRAKRIVYDTHEQDAQMYLLHEFGHAMLGHQTYARDINLLQMERDAWAAAKTYETEVGLIIDEGVIDNSLDSYRDWLHSRSLCPDCGSTGIQMDDLSYHCPACEHTWHANEARTCALRRYSA